MPTNKPFVLWVQLRVTRFKPQVQNVLEATCEFSRVTKASSLDKVIHELDPGLILFDYDYPNKKRLDLLAQTKRTFPSIPILMLIEKGSEAIAVWAFRAGVRDYLRAPFSDEELASRVQHLSDARLRSREERANLSSDLEHSVPAEVCVSDRKKIEARTDPVLDFIRQNINKKITLKMVSGAVGLSESEFSRLFRKEQRISLQEYIVRSRLKLAMELLENPAASITDAALTVGFNDLSYFSRKFREYVGVSAGEYRKNPSSYSITVDGLAEMERRVGREGALSGRSNGVGAAREQQ